MSIYRRRWPAVAAAIAITVSACGSSSTADDASSQGSDGDGGASVTASSGDQGDVADTADDGADQNRVEGNGGGEPVDESESGTDVAAPAANVPAVEVLDIADGSVVNLADELAGEDRAILFWFWAPH